MVSLGTLTYC